MAMTHQPGGKSLGKPGSAVDVGCEGVTSHDNLKFFQR
jgi:hypothetical protein